MRGALAGLLVFDDLCREEEVPHLAGGQRRDFRLPGRGSEGVARGTRPGSSAAADDQPQDHHEARRAWSHRHLPDCGASGDSQSYGRVCQGVPARTIDIAALLVPRLGPFYAVSVTLPFYWHSGILLVPLSMLLCGILAARPRRVVGD